MVNLKMDRSNHQYFITRDGSEFYVPYLSQLCIIKILVGENLGFGKGGGRGQRNPRAMKHCLLKCN